MWSAGVSKVCKTFILQFESGWHLTINTRILADFRVFCCFGRCPLPRRTAISSLLRMRCTGRHMNQCGLRNGPSGHEERLSATSAASRRKRASAGTQKGPPHTGRPPFDIPIGNYLPARSAAFSAAIMPQVAHMEWLMPPKLILPRMLEGPRISPARDRPSTTEPSSSHR